MFKIRNNDQSGLVSITVTLIIMTLVMLMASSFALLMRREQRQALDRQLSAQAFYAAESGVNDAIEKIRTETLTSDVRSCDTAAQNNISTQQNRQLDPVAGVTYTCVLVSLAPPNFEKSPVDTDTSTVVKLQSAGNNIQRVQISWQDANGGDEFTPSTNNNHLLPQSGVSDPKTNSLTASDGTGMLRATLMPLRNGAIDRANLIADAKTYFLYPKGSNTRGGMGRQDYGRAFPDDNGSFIDGECNAGNNPAVTPNRPRHCNTEIYNLNSLNTKVVYLRLKSLYRATNVHVRIFGSNTNVPDGIIGAQATIDATGKANDVLRRIQVKVPLENSYAGPEYAIESMESICKRLQILPNNAIVDLPAQGTNTRSGEVDYDRSRDSQVCDPEQAP